MPVIVAAIAVLTALVLLNLLLTFGVIRRLRDHSEQLAASAPMKTLSVGAAVPEFSVDGVSTSTLRANGALVAFMAPDCTACTEQLPAVRERLAEAARGPAAVLLVLTRLRPDSAPSDLGETLGGTALVVHEPLDGPVQSAFQVAAFPAFYLVDPEGKVAAVSNGIATLPALPLAVA